MTELSDAIAAVNALITGYGLTRDEMTEVLTGPADGGPQRNGLFPVTLASGASSILVPSPQKLARMVDDVNAIMADGSLLLLVEDRVYSAHAAMASNLAPVAGKWALVWQDANAANVGFWMKTGASGAGGWTLVLSLNLQQAIDAATAAVTAIGTRVTEAEANLLLLKSAVVQTIGRVADPVAGGPAGGTTTVFLWGEPAAVKCKLTQVKIYALGAGPITVYKYMQIDGFWHQGATITFNSTGVGLQAFSTDLTVFAGEYLGMNAPGVLGAGGGVAENGGWWQTQTFYPNDAVGTKFTNARLEAGFTLVSHNQTVTSAVIEALQNKANGIDAIEDRTDLLFGTLTQIIGRPVDPAAADGASDAMFVWNDPVRFGTVITQLKLHAAATGTIKLAVYSRDGDNVHRVSSMTLNVAATGLQTFAPNLAVGPGQYVALMGAGIVSARTATADGGGWWQVPDWTDDAVLGSLWVDYRLEVQFTVVKSGQIVTTDIIKPLLDLPSKVSELDARPAVADNATVGSPQWLYADAAAQAAPLFGGRAGQLMPRQNGARTLAYFARAVDVQGGGGIAALADVAADDALFGDTALHYAPTGADWAAQTLFPATAYPATDVRGGMIVVRYKAIANFMGNCNGVSLRLYSAGTPAGPAASFHDIPLDDLTYFFKGSAIGGDAEGRWQGYSVPVSAFGPVGGGADLAAVRYAALVMRAVNGASFEIALGDIRFVPNKLAKARAILSFDDAHKTQATVSAVMMARYGFPGVLYPSPVTRTVGFGSDPMTPEMVRNLHDNLGWQIGSQAWYDEDVNRINALTENQWTGELGALRNWHNAMGVTGGEHGSYFSGVAPDQLFAYRSFRKHFRSMRTFAGGVTFGPGPLGWGETYPFGDPMAIRALNAAGFGGPGNGAEMIRLVDAAIAHKGVAFFAWHQETGEAGDFQNGFAQLLAYLDAHRDQIEVCTEADLAQL